jgi:hypothetical protein
MVSPDIKRLRAEIITSVLTEGLMTAQELRRRGKRFYASNDGVGNGSIFGVAVRNPRFLNQPLYRTTESLFPVLAERPQDDELTWGNSRNFAIEHYDVIRQRMGSGFFIVTQDDIDTYSCLTPDNFIQVLMPRGIWHDFRHEDKEMLGGKVLIARRFVVRTTCFGKFRLPDLEELLIEVLKRENIPMRVTEVRLPIDDDLVTYQPREDDYGRKAAMKFGY